MTFDLSYLRSFDSETYKFRPGEAAPPIVCASTAEIADGKVHGRLLNGDALSTFRLLIEGGSTVTFANAAYDLCVAAQADPSLLAAIFRALREGRVHDVLVAEALNAIYYGHLGFNPDGSELRKPSTGEVTNRYSLEIVTKLVLGRIDAKANDVFRTSYALLDGIPPERWPEAARVYPVDDAVNTVENTVGQVFGVLGVHEWVEVPAIPGVAPASTRCRHCGGELTFSWPPDGDSSCPQAPRTPHKNLQNLAAQVEADFALKLGSAWGLRTDPERVEKLACEVEEKHRVAVERFQKMGWIRGAETKAGKEGTEDQAAVKRSVAVAYGAMGKCARCGGVGKIRKVDEVECRGVKERGRYRGCAFAVAMVTVVAVAADASCSVCLGKGRIDKLGNEVTCKNVFDEAGNLVESGCDGTGLDLSTAPMLPRTDKLGVSTDRDTLMESGDEDLSDYGENEFEKSRTTYVPYLRTGTTRPLSYNPNVLVATGRCSYEGTPLHQMPRQGSERECIRARGAWCGSPVEYVLGSTDYAAGELCTLSQYNYWLFGYSAMRDAINASGDPGILHSELAAEVLGIPLAEFLTRLKAKDKEAVLFRQSSKPMNFGKPAGMGSPKIVATNRKKNAGFTVCEGGPAQNDREEPGYWGIRFCISIGGAKRCGIEKVLEWKKRPTSPVCKACVEVVENILTPAYLRRFPEIKDLFKWASKMVDDGRPAPSVVWDAEAQAPRIIRERGGCDFSAFCNNGFQSMLADIGKHAFVRATRECYLGVRDDGSSSSLAGCKLSTALARADASSLAGCRLPLFLHDEPLSELILDTAHLSGPRIAEIMVESGRTLAPDVTWKAETALARYWNKSMEPVYVDGKLSIWEPKTKIT